MANEEHVRILKQGVRVWNQWRQAQPEIRPDLNGVNLMGAILREAVFSGAFLSGANLTEADLTGAILLRTILFRTDLRGASLCGTALRLADLYEADLCLADLARADLRRATLRGATFAGSHLCEADLRLADLTGADLYGADFTSAKIGWTVFGDVDLSEVKGLETVYHAGPSTIGIDTITASQGNIPEVFLRGAGVSDTFIADMKSLTGAAFDFYSCFISHSSQDKPFVEQLYADLQAKGVRCWYAPEDLKIGEPFLLGIDKGIRLHDKLLLVLSEHSVASGWVQHEVLSAMAKEQGKEPWVLFPIRVDDAVMSTDMPWATMIKQSRHISDFTHWKDHDAYQKAFERLLRDLKVQGKITP